MCMTTFLIANKLAGEANQPSFSLDEETIEKIAEEIDFE